MQSHVLLSLVQRHVRATPLLLLGVFAVTLISSLAITLVPLYHNAVGRELQQLDAAKRGLVQAQSDLLFRATVVSDMMAYDEQLRELFQTAVKDSDSANLRKLQLKLGAYQKNGRASFGELIATNGKVLISSGLGDRGDVNVSDWPLFRDTNEMKNQASLTKIGERIFAASTAAVRYDGSMIGVAVVGYELDSERLHEWAKNFTSALTLYVGEHAVASSQVGADGKPVMLQHAATDGDVADIAGSRYAIDDVTLSAMEAGDKTVNLGRVVVATSLDGFFQKLNSIATFAAFILVPLFLLAIVTIFAISQGLVSFTDRLQHMTSRLRAILTCTKDLAVIRDRIVAARAALATVIPELSLGKSPSAKVFLCGRSKGSCVEIQLLDSGILVSSPVQIPRPELPKVEKLVEAMDTGLPMLNAAQELLLPITYGEAKFGCLVISPFLEKEIPEDEGRFASTIASSLGISLENIAFTEMSSEQAKLEAEIYAAKVVQDSLLPRPLSLPGLEVHNYCASAAQTGGDWYGYHYDKNFHRMYFFMGDVTGHGFPSALVTGVACGAIYSGEKRADLISSQLLIPNEDPATRLLHMTQIVNEVVLETGSRTDRLMTMFFLCLDLITGELSYVNAAHNHPILLRLSEGTARALVSCGTRLGFSGEAHHNVERAQLNPGDVVFLYTDGLVENVGPTGATLTVKRLRTILQSCKSSQEVKDKVLEAGKEVWLDMPPADDVSFLVFSWGGPISRSALEAMTLRETARV